MKITFIFQNVFIIWKFHLIHNLEPTYWENRIVHIGELIYLDLDIYDFYCDHYNYNYSFVKFEFLLIYADHFKFNTFAPIFNYTCFCKSGLYRNAKIQLNLIINEIEPVHSCEMKLSSNIQLGWSIIFMYSTIFFIYIGVCLLSAFLVTDGVFRNSIQSDLLDKMGFDEAWGSDEMTIPSIIVFDKTDGKEQFLRIMELVKEANKNLELLRYAHRPRDGRMEHLLNLLNDEECRTSPKNKTNSEYKNQRAIQQSKREIILKELHKRTATRNEARMKMQKKTEFKENEPNVPQSIPLYQPMFTVQKGSAASLAGFNMKKTATSLGGFNTKQAAMRIHTMPLNIPKNYPLYSHTMRQQPPKNYVTIENLTSEKKILTTSPPLAESTKLKRIFTDTSDTSIFTEFSTDTQYDTTLSSPSRDTLEMSWMLTKTMKRIKSYKNEEESVTDIVKKTKP